MASSNSAPPPSPPNDNKTTGAKGKPPSRFFLLAGLSVVGLGLTALLLVVFGLAMAYPNLPELDTLTDYRPKMPLRIFSADNVLIGEFGEERRNLVRIKDIPDVMKKAVLAIEDDRFYEHGGVDYTGILRAALHNATGGAKQGASTITQQVARNFFLSSEQTSSARSTKCCWPGRSKRTSARTRSSRST
jgi:penicillin-binding protein 1A